jgi:16S rRNA (guanine1516-N2)-methyltransferase
VLLATSLPKLNNFIDSIAVESEAFLPQATLVAEQLSLAVSNVEPDKHQLVVSASGLALQIPELGKPISIDFSTGKYDHRRKFGGGRGQPLAKAVGLKKGQTPRVIDATAGFARDAFVLANLGCEVTMLEQNPLMSLLIQDALERGSQSEAITEIIARLSIHNCNAVDYLQHLSDDIDVIYMDPMYPCREKSALVKKEMQLLHQLIGPDEHSAELLTTARQKALKRVVVKRPKGAEYVGGEKPSVSIESKNTRYDIYPTS